MNETEKNRLNENETQAVVGGIVDDNKLERIVKEKSSPSYDIAGETVGTWMNSPTHRDNVNLDDDDFNKPIFK